MRLPGHALREKHEVAAVLLDREGLRPGPPGGRPGARVAAQVRRDGARIAEALLAPAPGDERALVAQHLLQRRLDHPCTDSRQGPEDVRTVGMARREVGIAHDLALVEVGRAGLVHFAQRAPGELGALAQQPAPRAGERQRIGARPGLAGEPRRRARGEPHLDACAGHRRGVGELAPARQRLGVAALVTEAESPYAQLCHAVERAIVELAEHKSHIQGGHGAGGRLGSDERPDRAQVELRPRTRRTRATAAAPRRAACLPRSARSRRSPSAPRLSKASTIQRGCSGASANKPTRSLRRAGLASSER